jgi:hypothetical protein
MSRITAFRISISFVLLLGHMARADEPPRYRFEVGQKLIYAGKSEARYKDDKHEFNTDDALKWTIWVVRKNENGSWRLILQSNKVTSRPGRGQARISGSSG